MRAALIGLDSSPTLTGRHQRLIAIPLLPGRGYGAPAVWGINAASREVITPGKLDGQFRTTALAMPPTDKGAIVKCEINRMESCIRPSTSEQRSVSRQLPFELQTSDFDCGFKVPRRVIDGNLRLKVPSRTRATRVPSRLTEPIMQINEFEHGQLPRPAKNRNSDGVRLIENLFEELPALYPALKDVRRGPPSVIW